MLTHKKKRNSARSRSDNVEVSESGHVVIGVRIVQCPHAIMDNCEHVVIGVRVMHCHHAFMANSEFSTFGPNFILVPISTCNVFPVPTCCQAVCVDRHFFPVAILCTLLHRENTSFEVLYLRKVCHGEIQCQPSASYSAELRQVCHHGPVQNLRPAMESTERNAGASAD